MRTALILLALTVSVAAQPTKFSDRHPALTDPVDIGPRTVRVERIVIQRPEWAGPPSDTFKGRWPSDIPPTTQGRPVVSQRAEPEPFGVSMSLDEPTGFSAPLPRPRRVAEARPDAREQATCLRHRMRTVYYGRTWRCRR
jgi:hypothetical protein